jgi:hypothetical protein
MEGNATVAAAAAAAGVLCALLPPLPPFFPFIYFIFIFSSIYMYIHYFNKKKPGEIWVLIKNLILQVLVAGTCSTQNMHPDPCRPVITGDLEP